MVFLRKKSLKKNDTHFLLDGDFFVFRWLTYMFEKAKGLRICKTIHIFFGAWDFLLIDEKMY